MALGDSIGRIEVVCGPMFCGKTEELLRRIRRAQIAKQEVLLIKPTIDDRYSEDSVASHDGTQMKALQMEPRRVDQIPVLWRDNGSPPVVGIDEGQFFKMLGYYVRWLAERRVRVIVAGLDLDYRGKPFLDPELLSVAEDVTKLTAVCHTCGKPAIRTQRLSKERQQVLIGAEGKYEARCRVHWTGG